MYSRRTDLSFSERPSLGEFNCFRNLSLYVVTSRVCVRVSFFFFRLVSSTDYLALSLQSCLKFQVGFDRGRRKSFSLIELSSSFTCWTTKVVGVRRFLLKFSITTLEVFDKHNYTESRKLHAIQALNSSRWNNTVETQRKIQTRKDTDTSTAVINSPLIASINYRSAVQRHIALGAVRSPFIRHYLRQIIYQDNSPHNKYPTLIKPVIQRQPIHDSIIPINIRLRLTIQLKV